MLDFIHARFRLVVIVSLTLIIGGIYAAINISSYAQSVDTTSRIAHDILNATINKTDSDILEKNFREEFFFVEFDSDMQPYLYAGENTSLNEKEAFSIARTAAESPFKDGYLADYYYIVTEKQDGKSVFMLSAERHIAQSLTMLGISTIICAGIYIISYLILMAFAKKLLAPIFVNISKQNKFIEDASHELKTPVAIISADTEVIEITQGKSEWTDSIKKQTKRLKELTESMMKLLSKENVAVKKNFEAVFLSDCACACVLDFRAAALTKNINIKTNIQKNVTVFAVKEDIKTLLDILCDNAVKYAKQDTEIAMKLKKDGSLTVFSIKNTCEKDNIPDTSCIFDKFYRADKSRSRNTGGTGLGLAIAKAICEANKADIKAEVTEGDNIVFTVTFTMTAKTPGI